MAGPPGTTPDPLALFQALAAAPGEFDFFQAMRRIEVAHPDQPRFGEAARPADEPVRLGQEPTLAFPPGTLARFTPASAQGSPRMSVHFFGLFGPNGPLPLHLTEHAREQIRDDADPAFSRFTDIFHHRLLMLFYRAWATAEPVRSLDRPESNAFSRYMAALVGLGLPAFDNRNLIADEMKLFFAGRFAMQTRNAEGLRALLIADLGVPVDIEEFIGSWLTIPPEARWKLGAGKQAGRLGSSSILGGRAWQCDQKFRFVVGPVGAGTYDDFLPGGSGVLRIQAMVQSYLGEELEWDMRVLALNTARPALRLGQGRLAYSAWLGPRPHVQPLQDVVFEPMRLGVA